MKKRKSYDTLDITNTAHSVAPVMLILSTFRRAEQAIQIAFEKAAPIGNLILVNVVDVNLGRCFLETDIGLYPEIKKRAETELLEAHKQQAYERMRAIAERAEAKGLKVEIHIRAGAFARVCGEIISEVNPSLIVIPVPRRPAWIRKLFGSPADYMVSHSSCPVMEAGQRAH